MFENIKRMKKQDLRITGLVSKILLYVILIIHSFIVLFPIYMMIAGSLKDRKEIFYSPYKFPVNFRIENLIDVIIRGNIGRNFFNSLLITTSAVIIILLVSSLISYALAKYEFKLNKLIYYSFVIGLFLPIRLGSINIVKNLIDLGLYDNLASVIIINATLGLPLAVFILTDFIRMVPEELSNSARIDGCSEPGIFLKIVLPLLKPAVITIVLFNTIRIWNDFWWSLLLIRDKNLRPITLAVSKYFGEHVADYGKIFSVLTISSMPLIIIYLILSRFYIRGLTGGAFKE